ncbi:MAG: hypothetical protein ACRDPY_08550 [Streptosporangiaceae bacterium]
MPLVSASLQARRLSGQPPRRTSGPGTIAPATVVRVDIVTVAELMGQARSRSACSRRHAARGTRSSTRRSRRQAAIRSVIVTLTPLPLPGVFSKLDG